MAMPQCSRLPVLLKQFWKKFPTLWLTGEFSVFVCALGHIPGHPGLGPAKHRCPSPGHQGSVTPGGTGAPPSLPPVLTDVLDKGPELSLSWNPSNCLSGDFWGVFPSFLVPR